MCKQIRYDIIQVLMQQNIYTYRRLRTNNEIRTRIKRN